VEEEKGGIAGGPSTDATLGGAEDEEKGGIAGGPSPDATLGGAEDKSGQGCCRGSSGGNVGLLSRGALSR